MNSLCQYCQPDTSYQPDCTLTLVPCSAGYGFSTDGATSNVVLIKVPRSTTFLNALALCDVETVVNSSQLTCRTRTHLAADASADDPDAKQLMPLSTEPGWVLARLWSGVQGVSGMCPL